MKRLLKTMCLSLLVAITLQPAIIDADIRYLPPPKPLTVREIIVKYAVIYAVPEKEINFVIEDESGFTCIPKGSNDQGLAYGPAQYHRGTFEHYEALMGEDLDYHSCEDQIKLMAWQFSHIPKSKCEWTKWRKTYCHK